MKTNNKMREACEMFVTAYSGKCVDIAMLAEAYRKAKSALAAPSRNCDVVPIEAPEAADVFHRERPWHGYDYETHDWLLAPARKKGETDGSK